MAPAPLEPSDRRRVAVVGSGVAGLTAAHVLARSPRPHHVTLYEADARLGGHAHTHDLVVATPDGDRTVGVDTGFIVHNDRTYPTLTRLFAELGVETQDSDMSMSVRDDAAGLEYAGARGLRGLFPAPRNALTPAYLRMLAEVNGFHRAAQRLLATPATPGDPGETLRSFVDRVGFTPFFVRSFLEPLVAAVWSCDPVVALDYPARYLFTFLDHHGMLTVFGSPTWRTVTGGSARYVERVAAGLHEIRRGCAVVAVTESADAVTVTDDHGRREAYDAVVLATHPHQALAMLTDPSDQRCEVLGAMTYTPNVAQLHTDESVLPRHAGARASWNYWRRADGDPQGAVLVSYDISRLMRLDVPDTRFIVTLGGADRVDPSTVIDTMTYEHPLYTPRSVAAQAQLRGIRSPRVAFAGAYHGWGFHEDGALSGVDAARHLGVEWETTVSESHLPGDWAADVPTPEPVAS